MIQENDEDDGVELSRGFRLSAGKASLVTLAVISIQTPR